MVDVSISDGLYDLQNQKTLAIVMNIEMFTCF